MPVEVLTGEQAEAYGTFVLEPTRPELEGGSVDGRA
jgi:hypothetical protein